MKHALAFAVFCIAVTAPTLPDAMQPPIDRAAMVRMLAPLEPSDVELVSVHTVIDCRSEPDRACAFRSDYRLRHSGDRRTLDVVADGYRISGLELTVDGARRAGEPVDHDPLSEDTLGVDPRSFPMSTRTTRQFTVELGPEATIVVTGTMRARPPRDSARVRVSLPIRHPLLGGDPGITRLNYSFDLQTLARWAGEPELSFDRTAPPSWEVTPNVSDEDLEPSETSLYGVHARITATGLKHGGPYVAFGGTLDETRGLRGRLGYEVGYGLWTVYGVAVDTDFQTHATIAPSIHGASAGWSCIFPSFGFGVGPALRVGDSTALGGRIQAEIQLPYVGVVGNLDWYPGLDAPDVTDFAILGRLSL